MAKLFLVRHGKTEWNRFLRYQGWSDVDLSPEGIKQAERLRDRLSKQRIEIIYSSDLKRALRTAQIIAQKSSLRIIPLQELREMNFGEFEGLTWEEIKSKYPGVENYWPKEISFTPPGGESVIELSQRVSNFLNRLRNHTPIETVLIVSHGGFLRVLLCLLLDIGLENWYKLKFDPGSLSIADTNPPSLFLLNDTCHLNSDG